MSVRIRYSFHALQRMHQRRITVDEIRYVVENGTVIEDYPEDTPWPSKLRFAECNHRPLHIVSAWDEDEEQEVIITVYEPDPCEWTDNYMRRAQ